MRSFCTALLILACACRGALFGQETTASLRGFIRDPAGRVVPGAKVAAANTLTGFQRESITDGGGHYVLPLLPVGEYELTAEAEGFRKYVQKGITLAVNQSASVNVQLSVGQLSESIEVVSDAAPVNTQSAAVGLVTGQRNIQELPLNGRDYLQLATLQPGIVPGTSLISEFTPSHPGQATINANGLRQQSNNFMLDGADDNDGFLGTAAAVPSPDSLQEFRILTSSYSAEYGRGGGAVVNVVTRGGTNEVHGSAYDFLRNKVFDARNFFSADVPPLTQNQFGGTLGGPLRRNRTFLFGSYEGFRQVQGVTASAVVPSLLERAGDFSRSATRPRDPLTGQPFPNSIIPANRIAAPAGAVLALVPAPNRGVNQLATTGSAATDSNQFLLRADHNISEKNVVSARYFYEYGMASKPYTNPPPVNVPGFPFSDQFGFQNLVLSDTYNFSPRLLNQARLVYSRARTNYNSPNYTVNPAALGFTYPIGGAQPNIPLFIISGLTSIGTSFENNGLRRDSVFQFQETLTWVHGRHNLRAGADIYRNRFSLREDNNNDGTYNFNGSASGNAVADLLLGLPNQFSLSTPGATGYFFSTYLQPYVQDDIHLARRLTVNLGLRYELNLPVNEQQDRLIAFRPGQQSQRVPNAPAGLLFQGDSGAGQIVATPHKNFAPRVGFAWDLSGDGRTSLRGGYGFYYDILLGTLYGNFIVATPYTTSVNIPAPRDFANPLAGGNPFAGGLTFPPLLAINVLNPGYTSPYDQQWSFNVERELRKGLVVQAGYLGSKGTHLPGTRVLNTAVFVPGNSTARNVDQRRPFGPAFGQILDYESAFDSDYNSLQLSANKRLQKGLTFLAAYTWSKAIDDGSFPTGRRAIRVGTIMQDQNNFRAERGLSNFDARHRFVLSYVWELPFFRTRRDLPGRLLGGWQLNGIATLQSGHPFVVQDSSDPNADGVASDRPDVLHNPNLPGDARSVAHFFDTSAFVRLPAGTNRFGNAGRNIVIGANDRNFDASLVKNVRLRESASLQFRWEVFNAFNRANFDNPGGGAPSNDISSPVFGSLQSTLPNSQRIMQFALRLHF